MISHIFPSFCIRSEMNSKWKISVSSCATLKKQPWTRNAEKRIFLNPFFRKTGTKIKILIPTFFGQNLYLTNPQVSFWSKQNWGTSSILKFLTIFQFFGLKTLKMVKKFQNFHRLFLFTSLPTDWNSSGSDLEKKR